MFGDLENKLLQHDFSNFISNYDLLLFQETLTNVYFNIELDSYKCFAKHRERKKSAKRDSGGLVRYIRKNICEGITLKHWDWEDGMYFKLDKDFFWV